MLRVGSRWSWGQDKEWATRNESRISGSKAGSGADAEEWDQERVHGRTKSRFLEWG